MLYATCKNFSCVLCAHGGAVLEGKAAHLVVQ